MVKNTYTDGNCIIFVWLCTLFYTLRGCASALDGLWMQQLWMRRLRIQRLWMWSRLLLFRPTLSTLLSKRLSLLE